MSKTRIIIFSGYNQRAVISFLRTLVKNQIDDYAIIASGHQDTIFKTDFCKNVIYVRKNKDLQFEEIDDCIRIAKGNEYDFLWLAPSTEYLNRFFLVNRNIYERMGVIIPLVNKELYEKVSDKYSFQKICSEYKIDIPKKYEKIENFDRPLVAKPRTYEASNGKIYTPVFLTNKDDFNSFKKKYPYDDFYFQDFIKGESIYLLFYFALSGECYTLSQQNFAQQFEGKSIIAAKISQHYKNESMVKPYKEMFIELGFTGLVMVEIRQTDNKNYMIEANPRFWGPSQLFCDYDLNFFELLLADYNLLLKKNMNMNYNNGFYFWQGGFWGTKIAKDSCNWYGEGLDFVLNNIDSFQKADIYMREDTMKIYFEEKLKQLYIETSKHSGYQRIPECLEKIIDQTQLHIISRWERERFNFIQQYISFQEKKIIDIGGNTGYFTFGAIDRGANYVLYYEGNHVHAEFVKIAAEMTGLSEKIEVRSEYYLFDNEELEKEFDIIFNLNVVHHLGDDFGIQSDKEQAKQKMMKCVNSLAAKTQYLVFQMGYNWKGNRYDCLFKNGTKKEMIEFVKTQTEKYWEIVAIGIANKEGDNVWYNELNENNILRNDEIGEFLNRPIFIMKSIL